jgi:hypothetical protein
MVVIVVIVAKVQVGAVLGYDPTAEMRTEYSRIEARGGTDMCSAIREVAVKEFVVLLERESVATRGPGPGAGQAERLLDSGEFGVRGRVLRLRAFAGRAGQPLDDDEVDVQDRVLRLRDGGGAEAEGEERTWIATPDRFSGSSVLCQVSIAAEQDRMDDEEEDETMPPLQGIGGDEPEEDRQMQVAAEQSRVAEEDRAQRVADEEAALLQQAIAASREGEDAQAELQLELAVEESVRMAKEVTLREQQETEKAIQEVRDAHRRQRAADTNRKVAADRMGAPGRSIRRVADGARAQRPGVNGSFPVHSVPARVAGNVATVKGSSSLPDVTRFTHVFQNERVGVTTTPGGPGASTDEQTSASAYLDGVSKNKPREIVRDKKLTTAFSQLKLDERSDGRSKAHCLQNTLGHTEQSRKQHVATEAKKEWTGIRGEARETRLEKPELARRASQSESAPKSRRAAQK